MLLMTVLHVSNCKTLRKLKNIIADELFEKVLVVMSPSTSLHLSVTSCYHPLPALQHPHTSQHSPSLCGGFSAYSLLSTTRSPAFEIFDGREGRGGCTPRDTVGCDWGAGQSRVCNAGILEPTLRPAQAGLRLVPSRRKTQLAQGLLRAG